MIQALAMVQQFNTIILYVGLALFVTGLLFKLVTKFQNRKKNTPPPQSPLSSQTSSSSITNARSIFDKIKYKEN